MTRKKGRNFRKRLRQHIRGDGGGGLRRKLSWVLYASPDPAGADLDEFIREHFTAVTLPMRVQPLPGEECIPKAELRLIKKAKPCLNRKGLDTPNVRRLRLLRAEAEAAGAPGAEDEPTSGDRAELPEGGRDGQEPASSLSLSALGRFRRDFWNHCSRLHPGIAPKGWAASNVRHPVDFARRPGTRRCPDNGWSFLEFDSRAKRHWDRMANWLHERRSLYERALRETADTGSRKRR